MRRFNGRYCALLMIAGGLVLILAACTTLFGAHQSPSDSNNAKAAVSQRTVPTAVLRLPATETPYPTPTALSTLPTLTPGPIVPIPDPIIGSVLSPDGPVKGAIVQVKGSPNKTTTDANGGFTFKGLGGKSNVILTAWYNGYFVGYVELDPKKPSWTDGKPISISLKPLYATDNYKYEWFAFGDEQGSASCGLCHREYPEWQADAHSQSAKNIRFETMYRGTNVQGQKGQDTRIGSNGAILPPDPSQPYYGPGYKLDNPQRTGNCATCHTPVAAKIPNQQNCAWSGCHNSLTIEHSKGVIDPGVVPVSLTGTAAEGVSCEFCHKVGAVIIDPKTNLPPPDMPGILSMRLFRPPDGQQVFFGTLVDVNRRVSYSPLEARSEFCAPCHYGVFGGVVGSGTVSGGTVIYNSYGEWLNSPYSDPKTGKTCQDCHMPVKDVNFFVFPEQGGITRDYVPFHEHQMPGVTDETLMKNAVTMNGDATHAGSQLQVKVSITNDRTGHDVPTDSPSRSMMLVVEALDADGKPLPLSQGPVLPDWTGNYTGKPGKAFAKILRDDWTGETPTAAYWRPVTIIEDTRLAALETDTSSFSFDLPAGNTASIKIQLVYRRSFQKLAQQKGWSDPDLIMADKTILVEK